MPTTHLHICCLSLLQYIEPQLKNIPVDREKLRRLEVSLNQTLDHLENVFLRHEKFLCGGDISIADLLAICELMQVLRNGRASRSEISVHSPSLINANSYDLFVSPTEFLQFDCVTGIEDIRNCLWIMSKIFFLFLRVLLLNMWATDVCWSYAEFICTAVCLNSRLS